jgi:hypothetical protein
MPTIETEKIFGPGELGRRTCGTQVSRIDLARRRIFQIDSVGPRITIRVLLLETVMPKDWNDLKTLLCLPSGDRLADWQTERANGLLKTYLRTSIIIRGNQEIHSTGWDPAIGPHGHGTGK